MAPFRNFLTKKSIVPNGGEADSVGDGSHPALDGHRSNPLPMLNYDDSPKEFKLSVVDGNGAYLPPSPPEKSSFWRRHPGSARTSNHRNLIDENEPFSISRESFDSYRRSFDISARSPISHSDTLPSRTSLDSRLMSPATLYTSSFEKPAAMEEECFEDVGLDDETRPKKKGILSRLGDFSSDTQAFDTLPKVASPLLGLRLPGRKRGLSGVGSELGAMEPKTEGAELRD